MLSLSIESIAYTPTGASFDVVVKATATHAFDTYGVKLNATELTNVGLMTFTLEMNQLAGFSPFDTNLNIEIADVNGTGRGPDSDTIGFHAWGIGGPRSMSAGQSAVVAKFTFSVENGWRAGQQVRLEFVTADPGMDTCFARLGAPLPLTCQGATFRKDAPPTQLVEKICTLQDQQTGKWFVRFNGQTVPIN